MNKKMIALLALALGVCISLAGCGGNKTPAQPQSPPSDSAASSDQSSNSATPKDTTAPAKSQDPNDADCDGIPDAAEKVLGTNPYCADTDGDGVNDKEDKDPLSAENPIKETSGTALPITIKDSRVEDNAAMDHLEITMQNTGKDTLGNFDIYYTITDKVTGATESYYVKLDGLSIGAGETATIHFDNDVTQPCHYYGNMNGLYGTSANGLTFDVQLHAAGYQPLNFSVVKSKGSAEVAD